MSASHPTWHGFAPWGCKASFRPEHLEVAKIPHLTHSHLRHQTWWVALTEHVSSCDLMCESSALGCGAPHPLWWCEINVKWVPSPWLFFAHPSLECSKMATSTDDFIFLKHNRHLLVSFHRFSEPLKSGVGGGVKNGVWGHVWLTPAGKATCTGARVFLKSKLHYFMPFHMLVQPLKPQACCEIHKGAQGPSVDQGGNMTTPMFSHKVGSL